MDPSASFLVAHVESQLATIERSLDPDRQGRGRAFIGLVEFVMSDVRREVDVLKGGLAADPASTNVVRIRVTQLTRLKVLLDGLHSLAATYRGDIGRDDLPVGLQYLVDVLIEDLLPVRKDPLIHLAVENMYSTRALGPVAQQLTPNSVPFPDAVLEPIVFNVPALDPANMMLSPVLAHEVGHTAVWYSLWDKLTAEWNGTELTSLLEKHYANVTNRASERPEDWADVLGGWCREQLCDALALVLTGPSFMFALGSFLPAPMAPPLGSHPYPRDRLDFCLRFLDTLGWSNVLEDRVPNIYEWARELAADPVLDGSPKESFLREAMVLLEPLIVSLAQAHIDAPLHADRVAGYLDEALAMLKIGVPPCAPADLPIGAWEVVLTGWLHALAGDRPVDVGSAAGNADLNALLVKTVELSSVAELWEST